MKIQKMKKIKMFMFVASVALVLAQPLRADCCVACYEKAMSDLNSCDSNYPPPQNAAWEACVGNAYAAAASCTHQT